MRTLPHLLAIGILFIGTGAAAQGISIFQGSDGTSGTILDLGGGFHSYSDSHGTTGTILDLGGGLSSYEFSSPQGGLQSGTILTFPPTQSNLGGPPPGWTPAPVLPFVPKSPAMPFERAAPTTPFGSVGQGLPDGMLRRYGSGRFGR